MTVKPRSPELWTAQELLHFLRVHGGNECRVMACVQSKQPKRQRSVTVKELNEYLLTARGELIEATGPSGQTRLLSFEAFKEVFGQYLFRPARTTGRQTDLGPLFTS